MTRTSYWFMLLVSSVAAAFVWSSPERWRAFSEHPHVAFVLDQIQAARARGQAPPPTAFHQGTGQPVYQPTNYPGGGQPVYPSTNHHAPTHHPGTTPHQTQFQPVHPPYAPVTRQAPVQPPQSQVEAIEGAQVIATVGDLVILAEEVIGPINQTLAPYKKKMPAEQFAKTRRALIEKSLKQLIPTKLLYSQYLTNVPPEAQERVNQSLAERFAEERLPEMMKKASVSTRLDLDAKFRKFGTSLERQRQQFIENSVAGQWLQQSVKYDRDVTYDQMLDHYR
ncbi:MAG: hypothetical protein MI757_18705, partial [Pirellulales bacterium]|nr:hypothetical protein [Pirellulales bacterium]